MDSVYFPFPQNIPKRFDAARELLLLLLLLLVQKR